MKSGPDPTDAKPRRPSQRERLKPVSVTVDVACGITGLGRTKLYELITAGILDTVVIGRRRLILFTSIEQLLKPRTGQDAAPPTHKGAC
jgi:excisionase family DNA binding protein